MEETAPFEIHAMRPSEAPEGLSVLGEVKGPEPWATPELLMRSMRRTSKGDGEGDTIKEEETTECGVLDGRQWKKAAKQKKTHPKLFPRTLSVGGQHKESRAHVR